MQKPFYRQRLPHIQANNAVYFVTYRLYGSIPIHVIQEVENSYRQSLNELIRNKEYNAASEYTLQKKCFAKYDCFLDANMNEPYWLGQSEIARVVYDSLLFLNTTQINLDCFTIMSNHVHVLLSIKNDKEELYKVMQSHKSFTAKKCNLILKREGPFWEPESYDHIVRAGEYDKIVNYILMNPVKAGLVKNREDWKWTYLT